MLDHFRAWVDLESAGLDEFLRPTDAAQATKNQWENLLSYIISCELQVLREMLAADSTPESRKLLAEVRSHLRQVGSHIQTQLKSLHAE
jgi:hypothetical protein